ncbi:hypothetical protein MTR_4g415350 [Medicago truncatula]|uniref:Uncharacterized protein n=1 Tax=Medicago truncatula TaxID=3880 RepID=A0A072UGT9_MEDTR|nr:hypothetical protein MTR_4g415350 [Medicago truncatula]
MSPGPRTTHGDPQKKSMSILPMISLYPLMDAQHVDPAYVPVCSESCSGIFDWFGIRNH